MFYKVNSKGKYGTPWQNVQRKVKFNDELEHIESILIYLPSLIHVALNRFCCYGEELNDHTLFHSHSFRQCSLWTWRVADYSNTIADIYGVQPRALPVSDTVAHLAVLQQATSSPAPPQPCQKGYSGLHSVPSESKRPWTTDQERCNKSFSKFCRERFCLMLHNRTAECASFTLFVLLKISFNHEKLGYSCFSLHLIAPLLWQTTQLWP